MSSNALQWHVWYANAMLCSVMLCNALGMIFIKA